MAIFINITANFNTQSAELTEKPLTLGRSSSCDYKLDDNVVSGKHIKIYIKDGIIYAEDLDTTNGSFINDKAFTKSVLTLKDEIKVGETLISLDKSKMSVKEIFSHKGSKTEEPEAQENQEKKTNTVSLDSLIKNAKEKQKSSPSRSSNESNTIPQFSNDENKKDKKDLKEKLKGLFNNKK